MAAGLNMSTSVGTDLAQEDPFLGALAGFQLWGVDFLDLVAWQTRTRFILLVKRQREMQKYMQTYHDEEESSSIPPWREMICKMKNQRMLSRYMLKVLEKSSYQFGPWHCRQWQPNVLIRDCDTFLFTSRCRRDGDGSLRRWSCPNSSAASDLRHHMTL